MVFLVFLPQKERGIVEQCLESVFFPAGTCITRQGSPGDGGYLIDEGIIRLEINIDEVETDGVLGFLEAGMWLGEFSLIDGEPRSANAYAHTDVRARFFATEKFQELCNEYPAIGLAIVRNLGRDLTRKMRTMNERLANFIFTEAVSPSVDTMVNRAVSAQKAFHDWPEERVDALIRDIAMAIVDSAEDLAAATVAETGLGVAAHKVQKIIFACLKISSYLMERPGSGFMNEGNDGKVMEIASPMGVVFGLIPLTNPVPTIVFKTLICLKSRNALIFSCHRNALGVGNKTGEIIQAALKKHGAPPDLVQWIRERANRMKTAMFMAHKDVSFILATGGPSMVKAAYSSGTPAIGVGPGNAPVLICADADVIKVAEAVITSKSFDNGVICGSENNLVVDSLLRDAFVAALEDKGAAVLKPEEINLLRSTVYYEETNCLRREFVGKSAEMIARATGIERPYTIRLLVIPAGDDDLFGPFAKEKLAPILSLFSVHGKEEGFSLCKRILSQQGIGHTAILYTNQAEIIKQFGLDVPASRILVNCPGSQGCIGMQSGLIPSLTLGCGTYGGSSTTDNVNYRNLLNIKRLSLSI